jgi:hypothetical protein
MFIFWTSRSWCSNSKSSNTNNTTSITYRQKRRLACMRLKIKVRESYTGPCTTHQVFNSPGLFSDTNISECMKMRCTKQSLQTLMKSERFSYEIITWCGYPKGMQGRWFLSVSIQEQPNKLWWNLIVEVLNESCRPFNFHKDQYLEILRLYRNVTQRMLLEAVCTLVWITAFEFCFRKIYRVMVWSPFAIVFIVANNTRPYWPLVTELGTYNMALLALWQPCEFW